MRVVMIAFTNIEYTIELTEALSELEDVMLMIPDKQANRFSGVLRPGLNLYPFKYPRIRNISNLLMIYNIWNQIYKFKPDIIHVQKGHPWFNLSLPLLLLKRFCLVTTIHDVVLLDWPSQRIPAFTYKPPIKFASQLIVHGMNLKESMIKEDQISPNNINVLNRGVNSIYTRYINQRIKEMNNSVMYFGRIWDYKGLRYLIEAEPLISKEIPDVKIIIAGTGENFQKYRSMMVNENKFIVYDEHISNDKVSVLFQQASVVVLPYTDASQSGVIPLAYAFKKPVIVTNVGSLPEAVEPDVTGLIVPPKDSNEIAKAIIYLLKNKKNRIKMGENAFRKTKEELSWDNIATKTVDVYRKAILKKSDK